MRPVYIMRRTLHTIASTTAVSLWSVPGFAQTDTVRSRDAANMAAVQANAGIVRVYEPHQPFTGVALDVPSNLTARAELRGLVESMLRSSPTFRRQCVRIAGATHLRVTLGSRPQYLHGPRARTQLTTTPDGQRYAVVEVIGTRDHAELIAHELEHIIEQLDGIDLAGKVDSPTTGVRRTTDGAFETERAIRTGRAVAQEMRQSSK